MSSFATYPSLVDRSVLISGGATGIGAAFVTRFAEQGARVAFLDIDREGADALLASLEKTRHTPLFFPCDVTDIAMLRQQIAAASDAIGTITVLINNAANDRRHKLADTTPDEFEQSIGVNLRHQYFATQAVVPGMQKLGGGSIICLGSTGWMIKNAGYPMYAMAKSAVRGLVNGLARELGKDSIRINALVPGWVITEKQRKLWLDEAGEQDIRAKQCMPGHLDADDLARAALFLAADDSRMCTGHDFIVDGGWA
jgi:D-xylose 1-dehydrogenase